TSWPPFVVGKPATLRRQRCRDITRQPAATWRTFPIDSANRRGLRSSGKRSRRTGSSRMHSNAASSTCAKTKLTWIQGLRCLGRGSPSIRSRNDSSTVSRTRQTHFRNGNTANLSWCRRSRNFWTKPQRMSPAFRSQVRERAGNRRVQTCIGILHHEPRLEPRDFTRETGNLAAASSFEFFAENSQNRLALFE